MFGFRVCVDEYLVLVAGEHENNLVLCTSEVLCESLRQVTVELREIIGRVSKTSR